MEISTGAATFDQVALDALTEQPLTQLDKGIPSQLWGLPAAEAAARRLPLREFPTPLLTLSEPGLRHNIAIFADWCAERGLALAPHGKTTMAPQLWAAQLEAGSWAITLANVAQLAVARAYGVSRVLVANEIVVPSALRWIAAELRRDPAAQVICWADHPRTVALMEEALLGRPPVPTTARSMCWSRSAARVGVPVLATWPPHSRWLANLRPPRICGLPGSAAMKGRWRPIAMPTAWRPCGDS